MRALGTEPAFGTIILANLDRKEARESAAKMLSHLVNFCMNEDIPDHNGPRILLTIEESGEDIDGRKQLKVTAVKKMIGLRGEKLRYWMDRSSCDDGG